uniref:Leucine-rich repeat-containing N-terminal plant-type domain-containing protein n=1 Tax=Globisporangium ultimum (strain ATCC 200006 / CBS 805.95 / DAOM BR144) TaxID=431595 RepID=K3WQL1_GLOUD
MDGCLVPMRPWFASSYTCAYANINCYTHRTMGAVNKRTEISTEDDAEILTALSAFDSGTLLYLVLSHCSPLRVPPILNKYRSLTMLEIYNSSIFEWPDSAAITIRTHPNLRRLIIVQTKLPSVPNALLHESPVVVVNLIATNLTTLPPEISSSWKRLKYFNMEHGVLREIPSVMASLTTLERLSVSNNLISTTLTALQGAYSVLNFANNPLQALPTTIRDPSKLGVVVFDNTLVADVPSWIYDATTRDSTPSTVSGTGTPFCKHELNMQETNARSNVTPATIECVKPSHRANGYYSLVTATKFMALA